MRNAVLRVGVDGRCHFSCFFVYFVATWLWARKEGKALPNKEALLERPFGSQLSKQTFTRAHGGWGSLVSFSTSCQFNPTPWYVHHTLFFLFMAQRNQQCPWWFTWPISVSSDLAWGDFAKKALPRSCEEICRHLHLEGRAFIVHDPPVLASCQWPIDLFS